VQSVTAEVKRGLVALQNDTSQILLWIQLLTPSISYGNNQGVEVQEHAQKYVKNAKVSDNHDISETTGSSSAILPRLSVSSS